MRREAPRESEQQSLLTLREATSWGEATASYVLSSAEASRG